MPHKEHTYCTLFIEIYIYILSGVPGVETMSRAFGAALGSEDVTGNVTGV